MLRPHRAWFALALVVLLAGIAAAQDASKYEAAPASPETAVFAVPKLTEGSTLKDLGKALAKLPGITAARAETEGGIFKVTFEPKKTSPDALLKAIRKVSKEATLVSIGPADAKAAAGHDCGKCPHAQKCEDAKKK